jgi:hypothetical protein
MKAANNASAEYEFKYKKGELHALAIVEKLEIPLPMLRNIALANGRKVAPDLKIVQEEYRVVNGHTVLQLQLAGTTQGIKFAYNGYYNSNAHGTVQVVSYTAQNLMEEMLSVSENFLNGLYPIENK